LRFVLVGGLLLAGAGTASLTRLAAGTEDAARPLPENALRHIRFLASDKLGGRGNGTPGLEEAARYIAGHFRNLGLEPAGDNGTYYQPFTVSLEATLGPGNGLSWTLDGRSFEEARLGVDFEPMSFSGRGERSASLVFAGYGITAPQHGYDDYAGVDARGKVVLVLRHHPRESGDRGPLGARAHTSFASKASAARARGAAALLIVNDPLNHRDSDELVRFGGRSDREKESLPTAFISRALAGKLVAAAGTSLEALQGVIDRAMLPASREIPDVRVRLAVDVERREAEVRNVLGYLPPARPSASGELMVIGAHYDHLGTGKARENAAEIHNGADDNASGTAGVIELGRLFALRRSHLKRAILFAAFAGEELGLLGSSHYVAHPTRPLERTVAMLNLDMIGRLRDKLYVGGAESSPAFKSRLEALATREGISLSYGFSGYGSSDHTSFHEKGIPALFFFTGLHRDYHQPSDDSEEIDAHGAAAVLRVAYAMAEQVESLPQRPAFSEVAEGEGSRRERRRGGRSQTAR
jgi:hypothetical protein